MILELLTRFRRNESGNIAMIFALSTLPVVTAIGAAVDYSRAASIHSQLQSNTDASALIACKSTLTAQADLQALAQTALNGYLPQYTVTMDSFASTNNPRSVTMKARVQYPTRFMKIANITTMPLSAETRCAAGENFFEIALVLDTTYSMTNSAGTKTKIEALRESATSFVNTMFTNFSATHVKMSIVPFAASVKVNPDTYAPGGTPTALWLDSSGTSAAHWQNVSNPTASSLTSRFDIFKKLKASHSAWGWAGCLESLPYPYNTQDATPSSGTPNTRYVPLFAPDEVGTMTTFFGFPIGYDTNDSYTNNSYIDDGTSSSGSCDNNINNNSTRMSQACKYVTPKFPRTDESGPNWGCTSRAVTKLTNVQSSLTTEIGNLTAAGNTNIHEGLHWGWRTISNTGVFTEASAYGAANTTKIIVLMTDGMNTWHEDSDAYVTKSQYSAYGFYNNADGTKTESRLPSGHHALTTSAGARAAIDQLTRETCTNARAKNVVIYTVAFSVSGDTMDTAGTQLMQDCAGQADRYFLATNASTLNTTFEAIARGIGSLRITR